MAIIRRRIWNTASNTETNTFARQRHSPHGMVITKARQNQLKRNRDGFKKRVHYKCYNHNLFCFSGNSQKLKVFYKRCYICKKKEKSKFDLLLQCSSQDCCKHFHTKCLDNSKCEPCQNPNKEYIKSKGKKTSKLSN